MSRNGALSEKSVAFAIRVIRLYQYLESEKKEFVLSKQVLRSGTSIGANVREAIYGQSKRDFLAKMSIALKEAVETEYWLELLSVTGYITEEQFASVKEDCGQLARLLTATVKSLRNP